MVSLLERAVLVKKPFKKSNETWLWYRNRTSINKVSLTKFIRVRELHHHPRHYYSPELVPGDPCSSNLSDRVPISARLQRNPERCDQPTGGVGRRVRGLATAFDAGILNLPTGYGKTTVALHIVSRIKKRTLIVVHKEFLMNQWVEKIQHFLPNLRLGKIKGR